MSVSGGPNLSEDGLVLYLDAANPKSYVSGSTTWADLSGNLNSGSLLNNITFDNTSGRASLQFASTFEAAAFGTQYVDIQNPTIFDFANTTFTTSVWLGPMSGFLFFGNQYILSKGSTSGGWGWGGTGTVNVEIKNGTSGVSCTRSSIDSTVFSLGNVWKHVTVVYTTNTTTTNLNDIQIYINGVLNQGAITKSAPYGTQSANLNIGRNAAGNYFVGRLSNVSIYNRGLSADEILQNFNAQRSRFGV